MHSSAWSSLSLLQYPPCDSCSHSDCSNHNFFTPTICILPSYRIAVYNLLPLSAFILVPRFAESICTCGNENSHKTFYKSVIRKQNRLRLVGWRLRASEKPGNSCQARNVCSIECMESAIPRCYRTLCMRRAVYLIDLVICARVCELARCYSIFVSSSLCRYCSPEQQQVKLVNYTCTCVLMNTCPLLSQL